MLSGIDVSRWEPPEQLDYPAMFALGLRYSGIRCTVGNYYKDPTFNTHMQLAYLSGMYRMPYLVVAPAAYDYGPAISAQAHMQHFISHYYSGDMVEAELPWVLDCELTRKKSRSLITDLIGDLVLDCLSRLGRYPIIYTRQTWWDVNVDPDPLWSQCPLWAARYSNVITSPWSDGYCIFRDWNYWYFWQWTDHGRVPGYSGDIDLDYFNGDLTELALFAGNISADLQLKILWREAINAGWDLTP